MTPHGSVSTYTNGCRCDPCRVAHRAHQARGNANRRERGARQPELIPHGTTGGYNNWGCRCDDCRAANAAWSRAYYWREETS